MKINGLAIENTFAEAFNMKASRIIVTADNTKWARNAAVSFTGFATSVIACGVEAGIEKQLTTKDTPDGRPGFSILLFSMSRSQLEKQLETRAGQCILTCPTTALFSGLDGEDMIPLGKNLKYFGDGYQISKRIDKLLLSKNRSSCLSACEIAVNVMSKIDNIITPFPGGVVRSGSKVGSKYKALIASTNDAFCPSLSGITGSKLHKSVNCVMEIVINGLTRDDIDKGIRESLIAISKSKYKKDIVSVSAGNYGGKLGQHHFHLRKILK